MHQHQRQHQQYGDSSADDYGEGEAHSGYLEGDYSNNDGSQRHASLPSLPPLSRGTSADASVGGGSGGIGPDLDFFDQYQMQTKARRKYERKWAALREEMRSEGAAAVRPTAGERRRPRPKPPEMFNHIVLNKVRGELASLVLV